MTGGVGKRLRFATRYVRLEFLVLPFSFCLWTLIKPIKLAEPHSRVFKMGTILPAGLVFIKGLLGGQRMGLLMGRDSQGSKGSLLPPGPRPPPALGMPAPKLPGPPSARLSVPPPPPARPLCPRDPRRPAGGRPWLYLHRKQPAEAGHVWTKRWWAGTIPGGGLLLIGI